MFTEHQAAIENHLKDMKHPENLPRSEQDQSMSPELFKQASMFRFWVIMLPKLAPKYKLFQANELLQDEGYSQDFIDHLGQSLPEHHYPLACRPSQQGISLIMFDYSSEQVRFIVQETNPQGKLHHQQWQKDNFDAALELLERLVPDYDYVSFKQDSSNKLEVRIPRKDVYQVLKRHTNYRKCHSTDEMLTRFRREGTYQFDRTIAAMYDKYGLDLTSRDLFKPPQGYTPRF